MKTKEQWTAQLEIAKQLQAELEYKLARLSMIYSGQLRLEYETDN